MHLVGPAMGWMPAWLDKRLPHLNIERPESPTHGRVPEPQPASG
jgi:RND superfamily putative drug exporter